MFGDDVHLGMHRVEHGARESAARSGAESGTHHFPAGAGIIRTAHRGAAIHGRNSAHRGYSAERGYTYRRGSGDHSAQTASQNIEAARG